MRERFWLFVAFIVTRPRIKNLLLNFALTRPTKHLGGYMLRYLIIDSDKHNGRGIRINHILREDRDLVLHDHPYPFRTILLKGWYVEEDIFGREHIRMVGYTCHRPAETFHRIKAVSPGGVLTLFITGSKFQNGAQLEDWGYLVSDDGAPPRKVHNRIYRERQRRVAA